MIGDITIKNFKSVVDVNLPLGRFNLLIGANGCGKSNILEGIALGAAAGLNKLDYEYFANRGIRVVDPKMMMPAFEVIKNEEIEITILNSKHQQTQYFIHYNEESKPPKWEDDSMNLSHFFSITKNDLPKSEKDIRNLQKLINQIAHLQKERGDDILLSVRLRKNGNEINIIPDNDELNKFIIYSPEETKLRQADNSNRTYPLGRHGEGLFAYLKELSQRPDSNTIFEEIKEHLKILDWFDDLEVPTGQLSMEFNLKLKDSYLTDTLNTFDQRSTNEGFLYLLFYLTLIISDETPRFFAIENIDTAFNPKLCREVTRRLIELARKHNKQIIATTHNPAVLDGINLYEDDVRLLVVRRTIDGYTKTNRVTLKGEMTMPLSEAWQKGFIGGLPDNF